MAMATLEADFPFPLYNCINWSRLESEQCSQLVSH
jgi:hypothetical protein